MSVHRAIDRSWETTPRRTLEGVTTPTAPVPPSLGGSAFNCPHCGAYAQMTWSDLYALRGTSYSATSLRVADCVRCSERQVWMRGGPPIEGVMLFPAQVMGLRPHPEMSLPAREVYEEARAIAAASPRAAAGLLRVAVEVLLRGIIPNSQGRPLNDVIGAAMKTGLPPQVGQALDVLRVNGNDALHGTIDMAETDAASKVMALCSLMNLVVEHLVAAPRMTAEMFAQLPEGVREAIEKRDA